MCSREGGGYARRRRREDDGAEGRGGGRALGRRRRARRARRRERTLSAPRPLDKSISESTSIFGLFTPPSMTVGVGVMSLLKYAVTAFACGSKPDHGETRPTPERVSMLSLG